MKNGKVTYVKSIKTKNKYIINIPLGSDRMLIEKLLQKIPYNSKINMIVDNTTLGDHGELVFEEIMVN